MEFASASQDSIRKANRAISIQNTIKKEHDKGKRRPGSGLPYGYSMDSDGYYSPNEKAPIVSLIFYLTAWGHSQGKIAKFLNDAKIPSPNNKIWIGTTIDYILNNLHYLGHLPWNVDGSTSPIEFNEHDAIISSTLWQLAHNTIALHKSSGKNNDTPFILRDIVYCKSCNFKLSARDNTPSGSKKKYLVYRCPNCKKKIKMNILYNKLKTELHTKLSLSITSMSNQIFNLFSHRIQKLHEQAYQLKNQRTQLELNENLILNATVQPYENIEEIFLYARKSIEKRTKEINRFIESLKAILNENTLPSVLNDITKCTFDNYTHTELRTLYLYMIKSIKISFEKETLDIEYRLSPFIQLEEYFSENN